MKKMKRLFECPKCHKMISGFKNACPRCGEPIFDGNDDSVITDQEEGLNCSSIRLDSAASPSKDLFGSLEIPANSFYLNRKRTFHDWELKDDLLIVRCCSEPQCISSEALPDFDKKKWNCAKKLQIEEGVVEIADWEFAKLPFESVSFPSSLRSIGFSSFNSCENLRVIEFSEGLETILSHAFEGCKKLENVVLPKSLKWVGNQVFDTQIYFDKPNEIVNYFHNRP